MRIEAYEKPLGWQIVIAHGLDNDLDAEAFIKGRCDEAMFADVITWILFDEKGIRCIWERFPGDPE
ncbi:MAG: hypothetical protein NTX82_05555 [Candidatus Parcubacteria bacterium]|nr:hypothetical protein [Candidatus Parcubacteria bacterium]